MDGWMDGSVERDDKPVRRKGRREREKGRRERKEWGKGKSALATKLIKEVKPVFQEERKENRKRNKVK